jgi:hypothetical protein
MSRVSSVVFVPIIKNISFNKQNEMMIPKLKIVLPDA